MEKSERLLAIGTILAFTFLGGFLIGERYDAHEDMTAFLTSGAPANVELGPIWKAWKLLDEKFVRASSSKTFTDQDHVWGIIEGLADSYNDPYTVFFPPEESKYFEDEISGTFGGIGVEIGIRDDVLTVIAPLKGTPGEEAGLLSGDSIVEIDGKTTQNLSIDEAVNQIRGEVGNSVILTIAREGEYEFREIAIERAIIEIPTLDSELRNDGIFVVSLYNFGGTAVNEMRNALRDFNVSGSDKLILDLRGNPGGYLDAAVEIAHWFLPLRKTIVIEDYGNNEDPYIYRSKGYDFLDDDITIAVLIDGGSASASEILAGALNEHGKAVLIGENTFGKGSVQELVDVTEETSIKITIARWLTPNGNSISEVGLQPDLEIEFTTEDFENDADPQLDAAVQYLLTGVLETPNIPEEEGENEETEAE